jgi:hypothetical protein
MVPVVNSRYTATSLVCPIRQALSLAWKREGRGEPLEKQEPMLGPCLDVDSRVPVWFEKHNTIGTHKIDANTSHFGGEL